SPPRPHDGKGDRSGDHRVLSRPRVRKLRTRVITGHDEWTGTEENWLGGGAPMWWSHADAATNRQWIEQAGLAVEREEFIPEADGGHAMFWACRP
ncbi:hypothetical protein ACWD48_36090, partial [Streptomyces sp. NPDC002519]